MAWADPSSSSTLAAESRLKPFFKKHGLDFQNLATVVYTARKLGDLITSGTLRESNIMNLNKLFPDDAVKIEKGIKQGSLKSGRIYNYAVFNFINEKKAINVLFIKDHEKLTDDELLELRINKDEAYHLDSPGLEGVWLVNPIWLEAPPDNDPNIKVIQTAPYGSAEWTAAAIEVVTRFRDPQSDRLDARIEEELQRILKTQGTPRPSVKGQPALSTYEEHIYNQFGIWVFHNPKGIGTDEYFSPDNLKTIISTMDSVVPMAHSKRGIVRMIIKVPLGNEEPVKFGDEWNEDERKDILKKLLPIVQIPEGTYELERRIVRVSKATNDEQLKRLLTHEFGHGVRFLLVPESQWKLFSDPKSGFHEESIKKLVDAYKISDPAGKAALKDNFAYPYGVTNAEDDFATIYEMLYAGKLDVWAGLLLAKRQIVEREIAPDIFTEQTDKILLETSRPVPEAIDRFKEIIAGSKPGMDKNRVIADVAWALRGMMPQTPAEQLPLVADYLMVLIKTLERSEDLADSVNYARGNIGWALARILGKSAPENLNEIKDFLKEELAGVSGVAGSEDPRIYAKSKIGEAFAIIWLRDIDMPINEEERYKLINTIAGCVGVSHDFKDVEENIYHILRYAKEKAERNEEEIDFAHATIRISLFKAQILALYARVEQLDLGPDTDEEVNSGGEGEIWMSNVVTPKSPAPQASTQNDASLVASIQAEVEKIHIENLKYTPTIPDKTILCHIVTDSILPVQQRDMLNRLAIEMREAKYSEKVVSLSVKDPNDPEEFMAKLEEVKSQDWIKEYQDNGYKVQFDVACPNKDLVGKLQAKGMQALAFTKEGDGDIAQVEGIILALRALQTGNIDNLLNVYRLLTGRELTAGTNDINELARMMLFILPVRKVDVNAIGTLNRIIEENIKTAA